ncbi:MAG TPA: flagellar hook capping FlgD N-terminal domain-containing protein [Acetobacteraceae bacterium]|nr:flagellar hook capping FlgD N-terminal domain-containing protein [Acetobacteraceae bacterium]
MSGTITGSQSLSAAADAAAAATAVTSNSGTSASSTASAVGTNALQQLGTNFNQFLSLLMTQLQNQDPTQPMDSNSFTTELVQFTGVQQQVATNTSLSQLISLQQTSQVLQSSTLVGHQATVSSNEIALQNGSGEVSFTGTAGQQVAVAVVNSSGLPIMNATLTAAAGTNTWQWNGTDNTGAAVPDGAYRVAVEAAPAGGGAAVALPFSVVGTTTGVSSNGTTTMLDMGALSVPLSAVESVSSN